MSGHRRLIDAELSIPGDVTAEIHEARRYLTRYEGDDPRLVALKQRTRRASWKPSYDEALLVKRARKQEVQEWAAQQMRARGWRS
jgi:hypothetical protein